MNKTRQILWSIAGGAVIGAGLTQIAIARADTGDEMVCQQLDLGYTPDQVTAILHQDPRFNDLQAPRTVWNAIIEQCP